MGVEDVTKLTTLTCTTFCTLSWLVVTDIMKNSPLVTFTE